MRRRHHTVRLRRTRATDRRPGSTSTRGPGRRHRPARWSLRARLLASLIALLAGVSIVISLLSVLALHRFLNDRLDSQLTFAFTRSRSAAAVPRPNGDAGSRGPAPEGIGVLARPSRPGPAAAGPPFLLAPGQSEGTIGVEVGRDGRVQAAVLDSTGSLRHLTATQSGLLLAVPANGGPHTVDLGGDLGPYRVVAASGERGVLVTGLPLSDVQAITVRLAGIVSAVSAAGLVVAGAAGALIVRLSLRPLRRVASTATRVARLPLDRGEVSLAERVPDADASQRTEVGQVGAALNRLLGHVEDALAVRHSSEERVRRFVADASHELRTPLAAIRGYAELTRRGGHRLPPDVAHAVRRVEAEATRMTDLVEDLLLLARLDEGRPPACDPVDLSALLVDAVSDANAASPAHRWQLRIPDEPLVVVGDPSRLYQVFCNLLSNARVHTPKGTAVVVSLRAEQRAVVVEVVDAGPGIPPALLPEVFERFARGDSSRSRAAGGTGLGLSIVSAVVASHQGEVSVTSRPGQTAFQVRLPPVAASRDAARTARGGAPVGLAPAIGRSRCLP